MQHIHKKQINIKNEFFNHISAPILLKKKKGPAYALLEITGILLKRVNIQNHAIVFWHFRFRRQGRLLSSEYQRAVGTKQSFAYMCTQHITQGNGNTC